MVRVALGTDLCQHLTMDSQYSPTLDSLELTVVVDNETDTLSSIDDGVDQIPEIASLLQRLPATREHDGHPGITVFDHMCVACHGLSVLVRGTLGDETRTALFDVGPYGDVWLDNVERLAIDLAEIEWIFLSHWHADHSAGFPAAVGAIADARSKAGLAPPIVDLHPDRPDQRGSHFPTERSLSCHQSQRLRNWNAPADTSYFTTNHTPSQGYSRAAVRSNESPSTRLDSLVTTHGAVMWAKPIR